MNPKFKIGDVVIHKLGNGKMIVCGFEERLHDQIPARMYTGYVQCRKLIRAEFSTEIFHENELELVKDTENEFQTR